MGILLSISDTENKLIPPPLLKLLSTLVCGRKRAFLCSSNLFCDIFKLPNTFFFSFELTGNNKSGITH